MDEFLPITMEVMRVRSFWGVPSTTVIQCETFPFTETEGYNRPAYLREVLRRDYKEGRKWLKLERSRAKDYAVGSLFNSYSTLSVTRVDHNGRTT